MIRYKSLIISIVLLSAAFLTCITVQADEITEEPAEVNAYINGEIPSIKVSKWTPINITLTDAFGIDWDQLSSVIPDWWMRIVWPLNPMFPQPVQRFLGHTSFRLEPEIVEGNPSGWFLRTIPSAISDSNTGDIHTFVLEAQTDDSAVDYSVVVGIKCTRIDTLGGEIGTSYIYVPVKAAAANYIKMTASQTSKKTSPKSMVYFTVDITNEGYYRDVFQLNFDAENGLMPLAQEQAFVMDPGETKRITVGIMTPEKFYDVGTPSRIDVYAYSTGDPTEILVGSLTVITEGIYISPLVGIILAPIIILLIIIYFLFFYLKQKREKELYGKPEKPWNIPVEKKHLEELKQKDKDAYEKERLMMEDEYKSAMLWYKDYQETMKKEQMQKSKEKKKKSIKKQKDKTENGFSRFFKKLEKKEKSKEKEKQPEKEKEVEKTIKEEKPKETPEIVKEQYKTIQEKSEEMQQKKEKALLKIKHAQEKQKKKIKK